MIQWSISILVAVFMMSAADTRVSASGDEDGTVGRSKDRLEASFHWPSFRGFEAKGVADSHSLPVKWSVPSSSGVKWKTPIAGLGHSSPVVWGNRLFVTTVTSDKGDPLLKVGLYGASPDHPEAFEHRYELYCLNKLTGEVEWSRVAVRGVPKVKRHIKATHANCTPSTNGQHVVAYFGSQGLYCYTITGELAWKKELGLLDAGPPGHDDLQWGVASSPVVHGDHVYLQCDARNQSFIAALRVADGEEVWRTAREEDGTWSTPTVDVSSGRGQLIVNGYKHMGAYDLSSGAPLWKLSGGGDIPVPTPVVSDGLVYITNAHGAQSPIYAIRTDAQGDVTPVSPPKSKNEGLIWHVEKGGAYMQTPIVYRGLLYNCRDNGVLSVYAARKGDRLYQERLAGGRTGFTASPVAGDGHVYFTSEDGDVYVIKSGKEFELESVNELGEICMATPALSEGVMFFRTRHHVVAVGGGGE